MIKNDKIHFTNQVWNDIIQNINTEIDLDSNILDLQLFKPYIDNKKDEPKPEEDENKKSLRDIIECDSEALNS